VALFANCIVASVVMTKPKEKDGITKYHVNRRVCVFFIVAFTRIKSDFHD